jgi:DNA repair exonuclease SbcCD nuclease subunit
MKIAHSADWHLKPEAPRCRLDKDWSETMENLIKHILAVVKKTKSKLLVVGDLFDTSQMSHWVVNMFLDLVDDGDIFAGNHDFKYRNMNEIENSAIGHVLKNPKYRAFIPEFEDGFVQYAQNILLCHKLVYAPENSDLAKFKTGTSCDTLIEEAKEFDPEVKWILIGDNHHKFHYISDEGIHIVNPGSPMIYKADMIGEDCGFYIIDTDKNTVNFHSVPDSEDLVTDQYLRDKEERSDNLQAIVQVMNDTEIETMDFFEICDDKEKDMYKDFQKLYEEIKDETIKIHTKLKKGA